MTAKYYFAIVVRLFAIVLIIYSIRHLLALVGSYSSDSMLSVTSARMVLVFAALVPMIIGLILWKFPVYVSGKIIKPEMDRELEPVSSRAIFTVLILTLGLFIGYYALADMVYWLVKWTVSRSIGMDGSIPELVYGAEEKAAIAATIIELAFSLMFISKAKTIAFALTKFTK